MLNKYLALQDKVRMAAVYEAFQLHFHNAEMQERIRELKEEQYQEGFLRDLFVNILGQLDPQKGFHLTTDLKKEKCAVAGLL